MQPSPLVPTQLGTATGVQQAGSLPLAAVMMASMVCNMLVGVSVGMFVPIMREKYGKDPAVGSSVLLTFATDTMGFLIFLGLATVFLL